MGFITWIKEWWTPKPDPSMAAFEIALGTAFSETGKRATLERRNKELEQERNDWQQCALAFFNRVRVFSSVSVAGRNWDILQSTLDNASRFHDAVQMMELLLEDERTRNEATKGDPAGGLGGTGTDGSTCDSPE